MNLLRKHQPNDLTSLIKRQIRHSKRYSSKYESIINAVNDNTKALNELLDEIREYKANK